jgi:hypothetical protein
MRAAILFCLAAGSRSLQTDRAVSFAADSSPVSKVIKLLKDMQEQLLSDKKAEEEMYDKLSCWCKVNGGGKETAITTAEQMIQDLSARIKALDAKSSELEMSIKSLTDEVASNTASLAAATKMREEEHAAFNTNEKDMILSIDSLKNAIVVLAKSQGDGRALKSFLQTDSSMVSLASVKRRLRHVVDKTEDLLNQILAPKERNALDEFMQTQGGYAPASGEIYGVLKQMRENFDANLKDMQSAESKSSAQYAALKAAKSEEIAAGEKLAKEKEAQLGKTKVELSEAKEDLTDTENSLSADQAFLQDLKERCSVSDAEWEKRSAVRAKEIAAVGEAIGILTDDDAHDLFHKSLSFLQLSSTRRVVTKAQRAREAASRVLLRQGQKSGNKALVQLAAAARLDNFKAVTDSIASMMKDLKAEMADEIKHRDYCNKEFQINQKETFTVTNEIKDLETKINDFASEMDTLAGEIATMKAELVDLTTGLQQANINRVKENQLFQKTVADQRATQVILTKALDRLKKFYEDAAMVQIKASHKQEPGADAPPPPPGFSEYKTNSGSGSVMTMIESIIQDAKDSETEAITAENEAQSMYESFQAESNQSIVEKQRAVTNKTEQKAKAESAKVAAEGDKSAAEGEAASLAATKAELHRSCDFVLANFEVKQEARQTELASLDNALSALRTA